MPNHSLLRGSMVAALAAGFLACAPADDAPAPPGWLAAQGGGLATMPHEVDHDPATGGAEMVVPLDLSERVSPVTLFLETADQPVPFELLDPEGEVIGESKAYAEIQIDEDTVHYFHMLDIDPSSLGSVTGRASVGGVSLARMFMCDELVTDPGDPVMPGTLRGAVDHLNATGGSICFDPVVFGGSGAPPIDLATEISTPATLSFHGLTGLGPTITTSDRDRVFNFSSDVVIFRLHVSDGANPGGDGGLVRSSASLILRDARFYRGDADRGGAIFIDSTGSLDARGTTIADSTATDAGGGIYSHGDLVVDHGNLYGNLADDLGAGIHAGGDTRLVATRVHHNAVLGCGGGVYAQTANLLLTGDTLIHDNTGFCGVGVDFASAGTLTVDGASIYGNVATDNLEGIEVAQRAGGGGIYVHGGIVEIVAGTTTPQLEPVWGNHAVWGGGIFVNWYSTVNVRGDSQISANTAERGGGIYNLDHVYLLDQSLVTGNTATGGPGNGGGMYTLGSLDDPSKVTGNTPDDAVP